MTTELKKRRRAAIALSALELHRLLDWEFLPALADHFGASPWVLVTGDDAMPAVHADVIADVNATLAIIDPRRPPAYSDDEGQEAWMRDATHHWARRMATQAPGSIRRYSLNTSRIWTPRRR